MLKDRLGLYTLAAQARPAHLGLGRVRIPSLLRLLCGVVHPGRPGTPSALRLGLHTLAAQAHQAYQAEYAQTMVRTCLAGELAHSIWRALAHSTVAAVRGAVADKIGGAFGRKILVGL